MQRGQRFKQAIYERAAPHGWTTDVAIADAANVSTNTLGNWWKGKAPELGSLVGLADALDQSLWDLLNVWQGRPATARDPSPAEAISGLTAELRAWREEDRSRLDQLETMVDALVLRTPDAPGTPAEAARPAPRTKAG